MTFIWPAMLLFLLLVPALVLFRLLERRRARRTAAKYGGFGNVIPSAGGRSASVQPAWILMLCGLSLMAVAMARPQAAVRLPQLEGTVVLAFDVSGSMAGDDFEPSRLEAAKQAARQFVDQQPLGVQVAVVAFSDSGFTVQVPSNDHDAILAAINRLSPQRGTSLANGILLSLNTIAAGREPPTNYYTNVTPQPTATPTPMPPGQYTSAAIVLLSDGENNERPDPVSAAQAAADRGVRIYAIGMGSAAGSLIHLDGLTIRSRLDEPMLRQLASLTGGEYFNAPTEAELSSIYENLKPELAIRPKQTEITALFAGAGAVLLLAAGMMSLLAGGRVP
jgi:Ca-activated chloride channel family protein